MSDNKLQITQVESLQTILNTISGSSSSGSSVDTSTLVNTTGYQTIRANKVFFNGLYFGDTNYSTLSSETGRVISVGSGNYFGGSQNQLCVGNNNSIGNWIKNNVTLGVSNSVQFCTDSFVFGSGCGLQQGYQDIILGENCTMSDSALCLLLGDHNSFNYSFNCYGIGSGNNVVAINSSIIGAGNIVNAINDPLYNVFVFGKDCRVSGIYDPESPGFVTFANDSTTIGHGLVSHYNKQVSLGNYNVRLTGASEQIVFVLGSGTSNTNRGDAIRISTNQAILSGQWRTSEPISGYHIATKDYTDNKVTGYHQSLSAIYNVSTSTGLSYQSSVDAMILGSAAGGEIVITLPLATGRGGFKFYATKIDATVNKIYISGNGNDLINNSKSFYFDSEAQSAIFYSDNRTGWRMF